MGFCAEFSTWLNGILSTYIANNTARVAELLAPAVGTLGVLYVMLWGMLQITGQIEEPLKDGLKRIGVLAIILGVSLHLWLYNDVLVETFFNAPAQLAAGVIGSYDAVGLIDQILDSGSDTASLLLSKGGILHGFSYELAGGAVYLLVGFVAVYALFLLSLSRIALSVLLALGPLLIALLFFESTKRFVESWLAQLTNYAFVAILTVLVAALMLTVVNTAAQAAVATGGGITIAEAVRVCLAAGLTLLVMRQVTPMAAGLASGIALSSFGAVNGTLHRATGMLGQFGRGTLDRQTSHWDSLSRKGGFYAQRAALSAVKAPYTIPRAIQRRTQRNTIGRSGT